MVAANMLGIALTWSARGQFMDAGAADDWPPLAGRRWRWPIMVRTMLELPDGFDDAAGGPEVA